MIHGIREIIPMCAHLINQGLYHFAAKPQMPVRKAHSLHRLHRLWLQSERIGQPVDQYLRAFTLGQIFQNLFAQFRGITTPLHGKGAGFFLGTKKHSRNLIIVQLF